MGEVKEKLVCAFCGVEIDEPYTSYWSPGNYCDKCGSEYEGGCIREMQDAGEWV